MSLKPDITFYSLEASRALRVAWLLEELKLPYTLVSSARAPNYMAPQEFKDKIGTFLGKSPTISDNGVVIQESGAITEYLCEYYDPEHRFIPTSRAERAKVREYIAAAEGTFMMHAMPVLYARWRIPEENADVRDIFIEGVSAAVQKDLDWLEYELQQKEKSGGNSGGLFLVGDHLTAADTMMILNVQAILFRELGTKGLRGTGRWKLVEHWIEHMQSFETFKLATEKINHYEKR